MREVCKLLKSAKDNIPMFFSSYFNIFLINPTYSHRIRCGEFSGADKKKAVERFES